MDAVTRTELRSAAKHIVSNIPPVQAVVLFGSRARGGGRADSDWDVAVLAPKSEVKSVESELPCMANVNFVVLDPKQIARRIDYSGSFAFSVTRDGIILAGEWARPTRRAILMNHGRFLVQMRAASTAIEHASTSAARALAHEDEGDVSAADRSQEAAELAAKSAFLVMELDPEPVHDLDKLADQFAKSYPGHKWVSEIRRLNSDSHRLHLAKYNPEDEPIDYEGDYPEDIDDTIHRTTGAARLQLEVLRAYAQKYPEYPANIIRVADRVKHALRYMQAAPDWNRLPHDIRRELQEWREGTGRIEERARAANLKQTADRGLSPDDPDQSQGFGY